MLLRVRNDCSLSQFDSFSPSLALSPLPSFHAPHPSVPVCRPSFIPRAPSLLGNDPVPLTPPCVLTSPRHSNAHSFLPNRVRVQVSECKQFLNWCSCEKCCSHASESQYVCCIFPWLAVWLLGFASCELTWHLNLRDWWAAWGREMISSGLSPKQGKERKEGRWKEMTKSTRNLMWNLGVTLLKVSESCLWLP